MTPARSPAIVRMFTTPPGSSAAVPSTYPVRSPTRFSEWVPRVLKKRHGSLGFSIGSRTTANGTYTLSDHELKGHHHAG